MNVVAVADVPRTNLRGWLRGSRQKVAQVMGRKGRRPAEKTRAPRPATPRNGRRISDGSRSDGRTLRAGSTRSSSRARRARIGDEGKLRDKVVAANPVEAAVDVDQHGIKALSLGYGDTVGDSSRRQQAQGPGSMLSLHFAAILLKDVSSTHGGKERGCGK